MKIAVVGGGIAGLTAASFLSSSQQVTVFEKEKNLGGLAACFKARGWDWPLERYYHHFFPSDQQLLKLAEELGIKDQLFFKKPKTSILVDKEIFRFDNPRSVLLFPRLRLIEKLRLGLVTAFFKINPFWKPLEKIPATAWLKKAMGKKAFDLVWQPLFQNKFGSLAKQIPASWFWTRIQKRSRALGYFQGGSETLIKALVKKIEKDQGQILTQTAITQIQKNASQFIVTANSQKLKEKFDRVIITTSPQTLTRIFPSLPKKEKISLAKLKSLGSLSLILALKESFLTDNTYWLNIADSGFPFVAAVEHTNYIPPQHYQNQHLLYLGGYYPANHPYFRFDKKKLYQEFLPHLKKIRPDFDFSQALIDSWLFKDSYAQPVVCLNYSKQTPPHTFSIPGLYWLSLHHVYPQDRGVNYAVKWGKEIAEEVSKS